MSTTKDDDRQVGRAPATPCPSDERLTELVEGLLSPAEVRATDAHLAECEACRAVLASMARSGVHGAPSEVAPSTEPGLQRVSDAAYEVGREIARGGMGRIVEGWDRRHRRRVAIKVLLKHGAAASQRFVREIRITARLQHPSIVPLYEAGIWSDGEPFFAMKLVQGRSLGEAIVAAPTLAERLELLPSVVAITEALAYAHGQRVVHRDLKPNNVLLGAFGETVVIDWGLAKELGTDDPLAAQAPGSDAGDPLLTRAGRALGTPSYMPPEQARGEPVDERADVYALGALLYHVLAGAPPFTAPSSEELLERVLEGPPRPLAARAPDVAPDLVTIVEKAMAREPGDRYPSAAAMAEDLRRWSEGRRVTAHHYSLGALLGRWVASHRTLVAMTALLVASLSVGGVVSVRRIVRERDRASQQQARAEEKERIASARREAAENLTEYMVVDLRARLATVGRLDLLDGVGTEVERYYRSVDAVDDVETPASLGHRAAAFDVMADVEDAKNDSAAARQRAAEAVAMRERAVALGPTDRQARVRLAESLIRLSSAESELTHDAQALEAARRALSVIEDVVREDPGDRGLQLARVAAQTAVADQLEKTQDTQAELDLLVAARDTLQRLIAGRPDDVEAKRKLGDLLGSLAVVQDRMGLFAEQLTSARSALDLFEELASRDPRDASLQVWRADADRWVARSYIELDDYEAAIGYDKACVAVLEALVTRDPANDTYRRKLDQCLGGASEVALVMGDYREARAAQARALAFVEASFAEHPEAENTARLVAVGHHNAARIELAEKRYADALREVRRSLALLESLRQRDPARQTWRRLRADVVATLAQVQLALGDRAAALEAIRDSEATLTSLLDVSPNEGGLRAFRGYARSWVGRVLLAMGDGAAAKTAFEQSLADFDEADQREGSTADEWVPDAVESSRALARIYVREGRPGDARARLASTLAMLGREAEAGHLTRPHRSLPAQVRADLAALGAR